MQCLETTVHYLDISGLRKTYWFSYPLPCLCFPLICLMQSPISVSSLSHGKLVAKVNVNVMKLHLFIHLCIAACVVWRDLPSLLPDFLLAPNLVLSDILVIPSTDAMQLKDCHTCLHETRLSRVGCEVNCAGLHLSCNQFDHLTL